MSGERKGLRGLSALLGCLAILIQCLVVQTHIHHASTPASVIADALGVEAPANTKRPADAPARSQPDLGACALCQSAMAGAGVLPTAPAFVLVDQRAVENTPLAYTAGVAQARASHHWQGRAPPLSAIV